MNFSLPYELKRCLETELGIISRNIISHSSKYNSELIMGNSVDTSDDIALIEGYRKEITESYQALISALSSDISVFDSKKTNTTIAELRSGLHYIDIEGRYLLSIGDWQGAFSCAMEFIETQKLIKDKCKCCSLGKSLISL